MPNHAGVRAQSTLPTPNECPQKKRQGSISSGDGTSWGGRRVAPDARASPCRLAFHSDRCANPSSSSAGSLHHIMTIQGEGHIADCRHSLRSLDGCLLAAFEREEPGHANHGQSYRQTLKPNQREEERKRPSVLAPTQRTTPCCACGVSRQQQNMQRPSSHSER